MSLRYAVISRKSLLACFAALALASIVASAAQAAPTYDLRGTWTTSDASGGGGNGTYDFTTMDMSTGAFSGTATISGTNFTVSGTENGATAKYDLTQGSYVAHDTLPLSVLPDGHLGGDGTFTDTGGHSGGFHAEQDAPYAGGGGNGGGGGGNGGGGASKSPSGTGVLCNRGPNPGDDSICTATVGDAGPAPTRPTGTVHFVANNGGTFRSGPDCALQQASNSPAVASCTVTYVPDAAGDFPDVTANYGGDGSHISSSGRAMLVTGSVLGLPPGTPVNTQSCAAAAPAAGQASAARAPSAHAAFNQQNPNPLTSSTPVGVGGFVYYCAGNFYYNAIRPGAIIVGTAGTVVAGGAVAVGGVITGAATANPITGGLIASAAVPAGTAIAAGGVYTGYTLLQGNAAAQQDPPDANFKVVARPARTRLFRVRAGGGLSARLARQVQSLLRAQSQVEAVDNAFRISVNRAGGALSAGSTHFRGVQMRAAVKYAAELPALLDGLTTETTRVAAALRNVPQLRRTVTNADLRRLRATSAHGLPRSLKRYLTSLGYSAAALSALRSAIRGATPAAAQRPRSIAAAIDDPGLLTMYRDTALAMRYYVLVPQIVAATKL